MAHDLQRARASAKDGELDNSSGSRSRYVGQARACCTRVITPISILETTAGEQHVPLRL